MSVALPRQAIDFVSQSDNPNSEMLKKVGDLSGVTVMYNMVLVATYIRPAKTKGGIIRPDQNVEEDVWQGKVGLVLKCGPDAFQDDDETTFNGQRAEVGEWVVYKVGDGWSVQVGDWPCRIIRDSNIKMKLAQPQLVF